MFPRCLTKVLSIELWKTYLTYVKETKHNLPNYKEKMGHAYNFALDKMGMDIASFPLWNEYVRFLKVTNPSLRVSINSVAQNCISFLGC